jgi:hypothetical protein
MPKKNSYADHLKEWEDTVASVAANASDLPQLEGARVQLEQMLVELRELLKQQAVHTANKQQVSKRLRRLTADGKKKSAMMRAVLKDHYGNTNEKLVEFGVQPFRVRRRKPAEEPNPEEPEKPTPQAADPPSSTTAE